MPANKRNKVLKLRTGVTIHPNLMHRARQIMQAHSYTNFSGLVEGLIRNEYARLEVAAAAAIQGQGQAQV